MARGANYGLVLELQELNCNLLSLIYQGGSS